MSQADQLCFEVRRMNVQDDALLKFLWDLSLSLALAATIHAKQNGQRIGVMVAIAGVIDFLKAMQFPADHCEPLHRVFQVLQDLEEGKKPSSLVKSNKNPNAAQGSEFWLLRGYLWAAVEIKKRMKGVRTFKDAAMSVAGELPDAYRHLRRRNDPETFSDEKGLSEALTKKLLENHRTICNGSDGPASAIVTIVRQEINDTSEMSGSDDRLEIMYLGMIDRAKRFAR